MTTPIIGPFPAQIVAGQDVSAAPVMADFNWIQSQVNANAQPLASSLTAIAVYSSGAPIVMSSGVDSVVGGSGAFTKQYDVLNEWNLGVFTPAKSGLYQLNLLVGFQWAGITIVLVPFLTIVGPTAPIVPSRLVSTNSNVVGTGFAFVSSSYSCKLGAGETLSAVARADFSAGAMEYLYQLSIARLG